MSPLAKGDTPIYTAGIYGIVRNNIVQGRIVRVGSKEDTKSILKEKYNIVQGRRLRTAYV